MEAIKIQSVEEASNFLDSIPKFSAEGITAADFSLDRFRQFCDSIDNLQDNFPSIHIAGSNGKGSTCAMISSIYQEAGYKTGLFTSPHLIDVKERFQINGKQIQDREFTLFFQQHFALVKSLRLTYFEITAAIAFWWFARQKVDIGVIETGLGGRLDATNVIIPLVSVITSVSLEHTDILGDTLQAVAHEIAGIIKPGVPTVTGNLPSEALETVKKTALKKNSAVNEITRLNPRLYSGTFELKTDCKEMRLTVPYLAPVQAYNIAAAWQVTELLKEKLPLPEQAIRKGVRAKNYSGRFEKLHPSCRWYFDGAHNVEAIQAMKETINTMSGVEETILVVSLMKDKIHKKMIKELLEFKKIVYYTLSTKRAASFDEVNKRLPQLNAFPADTKSRHSLLDELKTELVIFGGSFYFYPTVKDWITTYLKKR